jgi:chemotaxis protein MotB
MKKWQPIKTRTGNEAWLTAYADLITNLLIFFVLILSASQFQTGKLEKIMSALSSGAATQSSLSEAKKEIEKVLKDQGLEKQVSVQLGDDGLELSFESGVMFASGSAEILPTMSDPLQNVLRSIGKYQSKYRYAVEGHTDETPMRSDDHKDNWNLSSDRALQVRNRLESSGISSRKIRVEAYADTRPLSADALKGLTRDEVLAKHRRVVIRIY